MTASPQLQAIIDNMVENNAVGDPNITPSIEAVRELMGTILVEADNSDVTITSALANGVPCEWLVARGADPDKRLVYVHGGGYAAGNLDTHRTFCADISRTAGVAVLNVDYRLAPENPGPAQLEDGISAYRFMLENGPGGAGAPTHCFVAGDSAGGGLTLAMLMDIRDAGLPMATAAVAISPWADMTNSADTFESNKATDPMLAKPTVDWMAGMLVPQGGDFKDPRWSPVYGNCEGLPPLLIQVSKIEALYGDSVAFTANARAAGVDVTLEPWDDVIHVWHTLGRDVPESSAAIDRMCEYIRSHS